MRGAIAVILREDQRFLVIERSALVRAPGKLCFPGGEIEPGERIQEAVAREVREELQLQVQPVRPLWESQTPSGVSLFWWLTELLDATHPVPNPEEVAQVYWLNRTEMLRAPNLLESNREFLESIARGEITLPPHSP